MAFIVSPQERPAIEVCVNFGVFAGRDVTSAELARLAAWLLDEVGEVSIISEDRLETDGNVEASVHRVRIEVANGGERSGRVGSTRRRTRGVLGAPLRGRATRRCVGRVLKPRQDGSHLTRTVSKE